MYRTPKLMVTIHRVQTHEEVAMCICDGYFTTETDHVCTYIGHPKGRLFDLWSLNKYYVTISATVETDKEC